jgi:hypothetical protein
MCACRSAAHPPDSAGDRSLYRIVLRWDGDDPRIARCADDRPDPAERDRIAATLDRMARSGPPSATPRKVLSLIETHPGRRAVDLAAIAGMETPAFKWRVRRLKELGLTESLDTGYRLSARGQSVLPLLGSA